MLQGSAYAYYSRNILGSCEYIAQMANDCGYDFYTLGNHDFNYGQEYQAIYRNNHKGTCVCENVLDSDGNILYPHVIHTMKNSVKVIVFSEEKVLLFIFHQLKITYQQHMQI